VRTLAQLWARQELRLEFEQIIDRPPHVSKVIQVRFHDVGIKPVHPKGGRGGSWQICSYLQLRCQFNDFTTLIISIHEHLGNERTADAAHGARDSTVPAESCCSGSAPFRWRERTSRRLYGIFESIQSRFVIDCWPKIPHVPDRHRKIDESGGQATQAQTPLAGSRNI
jgi:hypothetical protein